MDETRIDIIIPAYNAHAHLETALHSIAIQTLAGLVDITIVDDCSPNGGYSEIIDKFNKELSIREIRLSKNGGCGVARQYGIDNTNNPFIAFMDADDNLSQPFALSALRRELLEDEKKIAVGGSFYEAHNESTKVQVIAHKSDFVWVFAKLYRRSYLDKYNIRFHPTSRSNEDAGFNALIKLCGTDEDVIHHIPDVVYYWRENPNSITRINDCNYSFDQSPIGYAENMAYAINGAVERGTEPIKLAKDIAHVIAVMYKQTLIIAARKFEFLEQSINSCKSFYKEICNVTTIPVKHIADEYYGIMHDGYLSEEFKDIIPFITLYDFIQVIRGENPEIIEKEGTRKI